MTSLFVDESKTKGYLMVAVVVAPGEQTTLRRKIRALVLPGQRRLHFTNESDSRRRHVLSTLDQIGVRAHLVRSDLKHEPSDRAACLRELVALAASAGHERIVLERDVSIERADKKVLYDAVHAHGVRDALTYAHETAHHEPLLWAADAIAWSQAKGGDWRRRTQPMIVSAAIRP
ncbi:hypothetical protein EDF31_10442 [Curtobacterium sp. PhB142]|nr:hypothetical protein EDF31_10442 [Curtobacterium sp. PhB142]TCM02337.1 hypothetical protein EDF26_10442 [Curtobacterium sp. PhB134]